MQRYRAEVERRRRNIRLILGAIIFITLPFYCAGIILWGTAQPRGQTQPTPTLGTPAIQPTAALPTATVPGQASITPLPITVEIPTVFVPPTATDILPTRFLSPTPTFLPTSTPLPTFTPPPPPTAEPITDTPIPFDTVAP
ncbi:MAG: hypothetical protein HXY41_08780 [Chloroflexi bacterium]|nr:hypothetical protein [Chloroflexota bacterium]